MIEFLKYTLKIWLTTVFTAPLILVVIEYLSTPGSFYSIGEALFAYLIALIAGLLFSSITWLMFSVSVFHVLMKTSIEQHKRLIHLISQVLAIATFIALGAIAGSLIPVFTLDFWLVVLLYPLMLFASIQFYQLPQLNIHNQENQST